MGRSGARKGKKEARSGRGLVVGAADKGAPEVADERDGVPLVMRGDVPEELAARGEALAALAAHVRGRRGLQTRMNVRARMRTGVRVDTRGGAAGA